MSERPVWLNDDTLDALQYYFDCYVRPKWYRRLCNKIRSYIRRYEAFIRKLRDEDEALYRLNKIKSLFNKS